MYIHDSIRDVVITFYEQEAEIEERIRQAEECECTQELRDSPCGVGFMDAFACFIRSSDIPQVRCGHEMS